MELTDEQRLKNLNTFKNGLSKIIGDELTNAIIDSVGGDTALANASFATKAETGAAYCGSFTRCVIKLINFAKQINEILPENKRADNTSLFKVCLLSQISKVQMFVECDDAWKKNKLGMMYDFAQLEGALKMCERSIMLAMSVGIKFTPIEYEAMRIMDKVESNDMANINYTSVLSIVIKEANELLALFNRSN